MRPLFTIHAGEYLVGSHVERHYKNAHVWVPSRDTGVDLLVSDHRNHRTVSIQVKFSKDYPQDPSIRRSLRACGWWTIDRDKLHESPADYWVFVLLGFAAGTTDFVIIPRRKLEDGLRSIHGSQKTIQCYIWVTKRGRCWETRGLRHEDEFRIARGRYRDTKRDLTKWLNERGWAPVARLNT